MSLLGDDIVRRRYCNASQQNYLTEMTLFGDDIVWRWYCDTDMVSMIGGTFEG